MEVRWEMAKEKLVARGALATGESEKPGRWRCAIKDGTSSLLARRHHQDQLGVW